MTEMKVISDDQMKKLPELAMVALAARSTQRIKPILKASNPHVTEKNSQDIELAISLAEDVANGTDIETLTDKITTAKDNITVLASDIKWTVFRKMALEDSSNFLSSVLCTLVSAASVAIKPTSTIESIDARKKSILFSSQAAMEIAGNITNKEELRNAVINDYNLIVKIAKENNWTDTTPVPKDVFPQFDNALLNKHIETLKSQSTEIKLSETSGESTSPKWAIEADDSEIGTSPIFEEDYALLPRWAILVFITRNLRRLEKMLGDRWPVEFEHMVIHLEEISASPYPLKALNETHLNSLANLSGGEELIMKLSDALIELNNNIYNGEPDTFITFANIVSLYSCAYCGRLSKGDRIPNHILVGERRDYLLLKLSADNESWDDNRPIQSGFFDPIPIVKSKKKQGCFIATACYGSYESEEVIAFRRYRDEILIYKWIGKLSIYIYYRISPPIASLLRKIPFLRLFVRDYILRPILNFITRKLLH